MEDTRASQAALEPAGLSTPSVQVQLHCTAVSHAASGRNYDYSLELIVTVATTARGVTVETVAP